MAMETARVSFHDHHINHFNGSGKRVNNKKLYNKEMWAPKGHHARACTNRSPTTHDDAASRSVKEKLRMAKEEIKVLTDKIQLQHQESVEALDFQEQFFKGQIKSILEGRVVDNHVKEDNIAADCSPSPGSSSPGSPPIVVEEIENTIEQGKMGSKSVV